MARDIDKLLGAFKPKDYTVRICEGIDKVLPSAPELIFYADLDDAVAAMAPAAGPAVVHRARAICAEDAPQKVLTIADALDRADAGLSIYTGLSSAVKMYRAGEGHRADALGSDNQQAADAVLKGLGLSWMVHELFEGSFPEKVKAFMALDTGQHLACYYAAIEVGLPFADNVAGGAVGVMEGLFSRHESGQLDRLAKVTGHGEAEEAAEMAHALLGPMEGLVQDSAAYLGGVASMVAEFAPKAIGVADKVASVAATAADALPVWRFLGSRLVAEYAVRRAVAEVGLNHSADTPTEAVMPVLESPLADRGRRPVGLLVAVAVAAFVGMGGVLAYVLIGGAGIVQGDAVDVGDVGGSVGEGAGGEGAGGEGAGGEGAGGEGSGAAGEHKDRVRTHPPEGRRPGRGKAGKHSR